MWLEGANGNLDHDIAETWMKMRGKGEIYVLLSHANVLCTTTNLLKRPHTSPVNPAGATLETCRLPYMRHCFPSPNAPKKLASPPEIRR